MHDQHATRGHPTLCVERRHVAFLRETFDTIRAGRLSDLAEPLAAGPAALERMRAEAESCARMIDGIDRGVIVGDPDLRATLIEQAAVTDELNEYERAVEEHEAFAHLLRQFDQRQAEGRNDSGASHVRLQRRLLHEPLAPPAYGGFIAKLARAIQATVADTEATAAVLEDKGLAIVRMGYAAASGAAMTFDELHPAARGGGRQCVEEDGD